MMMVVVGCGPATTMILPALKEVDHEGQDGDLHGVLDQHVKIPVSGFGEDG